MSEFASNFYFERIGSGERFYPVRIHSELDGEARFHALKPGSNRTEDAFRTRDQDELLRRVLEKGWRVRARPKEGGQVNGYSPRGRTVRMVVVRAPS